MALEQSPLDLSALPGGVRRVLSGPTPVKLMAARGLAPLKPAELATVLYQLARDPDEAVKAAADKTAAELPEKILGAALADAALDARVLDFFALRVISRPALLEAVLLSRAVADETIAEIVPRLGEKELEIVATNEQRLLRHPSIIAALYMNPRARMSTVDRAVELAVRNGVTVSGISRWDDLAAAVLGAQGPKPPPEEVDATFAAVAEVAIGEEKSALGTALDADLEVVNAVEAKKVDEVKKDVPIDQLTVPQKIRLATLGNANARAILIRDPIRVVAAAAAASPGITENEVMRYSANRTLGDEAIRILANNREFLKVYRIKANLVNNPKTPLPVAMRLLPFLHDRDLRSVARSKAIPSALRAQAKKLLSQKKH